MSRTGRVVALALVAFGPWLSGCGRETIELAKDNKRLRLAPKGLDVSAPEVEYDFGAVTLGNSRAVTFVFSNRGNTPVRNLDARLEGPVTGAFFVQGLPQALEPDEQVDLVFTFSPPFGGEHAVTLRLQGNLDESAPAVALLNGEGLPRSAP